MYHPCIVSTLFGYGQQICSWISNVIDYDALLLLVATRLCWFLSLALVRLGTLKITNDATIMNPKNGHIALLYDWMAQKNTAVIHLLNCMESSDTSWFLENVAVVCLLWYLMELGGGSAYLLCERFILLALDEHWAGEANLTWLTMKMLRIWWRRKILSLDARATMYGSALSLFKII